jgi:hypothetical protein
MAVPFLLAAVPTADGDLLVDGGVLDNCPLHAFDDISPQHFREFSKQKESSAISVPSPPKVSPSTLGFCITTVDQPREVLFILFNKKLLVFGVVFLGVSLLLQKRRSVTMLNNLDKSCRSVLLADMGSWF